MKLAALAVSEGEGNDGASNAPAPVAEAPVAEASPVASQGKKGKKKKNGGNNNSTGSGALSGFDATDDAEVVFK